jgi:FkbM family methyltransferase
MTFVSIPGTDFIALANDQWITPQCMHLRRLDWDRSLLDVPEVAAALRPHAIAIDVGAFIGDTTRLMLERGCGVVAFEPQPDAYHCLTHNCPDANCFCAPVGDGSRVRLQHSDGGNMGARQVWTGDIPLERHAPVRRGVLEGEYHTIRLDDLYLTRCDFIKIDVEGFEPWVLDGARETLRQHRPLLVVEVSVNGLEDHGRAQTDIMSRLGDYDCRPLQLNSTPFDLLCVPKGVRA